jgi:excinuclease ABC subunit C
LNNFKTFLSHLPKQPGVYQMLGDEDQVLYVGKAKNLKNRISSYFNKQVKDIKTQSLTKKIKNIEIIVTTTETEAVLLECNLIKQYRPRYNVLLRDDKTYPYIVITAQQLYPRIEFYRGLRKKNALYFGPYPNSLAVKETISLLQKIFKIRTCRDSYFAARTRPCLLYQIGRCTAPCVRFISPEKYAENIQLAILFLQGRNEQVIMTLQDKMEIAVKALAFEKAAEYRDQINRMRQIQDRQYVNVAAGEADSIGFAIQAGVICIQLLPIRKGQILGGRSYFPFVPINSSKEEVIAAFLTQHYLSHPSPDEHIPQQIILDVVLKDQQLIEEVLTKLAKHKVEIICPVRGEKKKWLNIAICSAQQCLTAHLLTKTNFQERLQALSAALSIKKTPSRIECFDISHSMGEATVASCVVFDSNGPLKSDYRRFNIQGVTAGDDYAAMHQVLERRFKRLHKERGKMPDLVLIDGGRNQLAIAKKVMAELNILSVLLVGVAKGPLRKAGYETLYVDKKPALRLASDSLALHLIQHIRDEAHRFAITTHRNKRDKARRHSALENIPGIGAKRRRELLRYFGGIQGILHASLDELIKVPGISLSLAQRLFAALHGT